MRIFAYKGINPVSKDRDDVCDLAEVAAESNIRRHSSGSAQADMSFRIRTGSIEFKAMNEWRVETKMAIITSLADATYCVKLGQHP